MKNSAKKYRMGKLNKRKSENSQLHYNSHSFYLMESEATLNAKSQLQQLSDSYCDLHLESQTLQNHRYPKESLSMIIKSKKADDEDVELGDWLQKGEKTDCLKIKYERNDKLGKDNEKIKVRVANKNIDPTKKLGVQKGCHYQKKSKIYDAFHQSKEVIVHHKPHSKQQHIQQQHKDPILHKTPHSKQQQTQHEYKDVIIHKAPCSKQQHQITSIPSPSKNQNFPKNKRMMKVTSFQKNLSYLHQIKKTPMTEQKGLKDHVIAIFGESQDQVIKHQTKFQYKPHKKNIKSCYTIALVDIPFKRKRSFAGYSQNFTTFNNLSTQELKQKPVPYKKNQKYYRESYHIYEVKEKKVESFLPMKHKTIKTNSQLAHNIKRSQKSQRFVKTEMSDPDSTATKGFKPNFDRLHKLLMQENKQEYIYNSPMKITHLY